MQATTPKRRIHKLSPECFDVVMQMQKRWPEAININAPKPLVIGVHRQIQQELNLSNDVTESVMRWYTRRFAYRQALEAGEHRYHLDGTIAAAVKPDERPSAIAKRQGKSLSSPHSSKAPRFTWQELSAHKETLMADAASISPTLKLVLRQAPEFTQSQDGSTLYCAFTNTPSGVPGDLPLGVTPLYLAVRVKLWNRAQKRAEQLQAEGAASVIYMVEAAVSVDENGSLLAFGKGIQVMPGKDKAKTEE